jgi:EF hand
MAKFRYDQILCRAVLIGTMTLSLVACAAPSARNQDVLIGNTLIENWDFFTTGDKNRDGQIDRNEFSQHPSYEGSGWGNREKSFIFWMIDDDKNGSVSLQEWFNNELGQFVMGDTDHDGVLSPSEQVALEAVETKLFADLGFTQ